MFRDSIGTVNVNTANLYLWLGRSIAWTNELSPDVPTANVDTGISARNQMEYLNRLFSADSALAIPRIDWISGTVYAQYSSSDNDLFSKNFYAMNSNSVYKCISNNGGVASTEAPTGTQTGVIILADGYQWKFMFNLSVTMVTNFLSSQYIPVPVEEQKTAYQINIEESATYSAGDPPGGHGKNAAKELGVNSLIVKKTVNLTSLNPFQHRQFGLILDPLSISGPPAADAAYILGSGVDFDTMSGLLLTCTNHEVISSAIDQTETIQLIISF